MRQLIDQVLALPPEKRAAFAELLRRSLGGAAPSPRSEPIAIIGMACRFPGGAEDPDAYFQLLREGRDAIVRVPASRWDVDAFYDPDPTTPLRTTMREGGFLSEVRDFDAAFFGISPREASGMDPQQRLLLEVAWEALENAGLPPPRIAGARAAVFIGIGINDYGQAGAAGERADPRHFEIYAGTGNALCIAANRLSFLWDLHGPSVAVDTACSSSLVAVHLACQSLRTGEATLAIAGGVNLILTPGNSIRLRPFLSPRNRCRTFDAGADGYARGEGAGVVVLKPLAQALADGDPIHAVIRGSAVGQDGASRGLTVPRGTAQEEVIRAALETAGVEPAAVDYVEAHGTGTALGDPIEANALGAVLGRGRAPGQRCAIGSVKTNLGHLEAAAGVAGLIKTALMLEHRTLVPSLNFEQPNPDIDFNTLPLEVQRQVAPWPERGRPAIAGVSAFGFGGTNAHVVLEEPPRGRAPAHAVPAQPDLAEEVFLLPASARDPVALRRSASALGALLAGTAGRPAPALVDVCHTSGVRRMHHAHRAAVVGGSAAVLSERLLKIGRGEGTSAPQEVGAPAPGEARRSGVVFVFSGQGSLWPGVGRSLLASEPVFAEALRACDAVVQGITGWSLLAELAAGEDETRLEDTARAQPCMVALQIALTALWQSWGVRPAAVIGHSVGELAAAHAAGALSPEEALRIACERGRLMQAATGLGGMVEVAAPLEQVQQTSAPWPESVAVAAINGPAATVLSGATQQLGEVVERLRAAGLTVRSLRVRYAFHGPQMESFQAPLARALAALAPRALSVPLYSTVTGARVSAGELGAAYWARNVREPVAFMAAMSAASSEGWRDFLEVGAHPVLAASVAQCLEQEGRGGAVFTSLRRKHDERTSLLTSAAELYTRGYNLDFGRILHGRGRCVRLFNYPWTRKRYWIDPGDPASAARPANAAAASWRPVWRPLPWEDSAAVARPGRWVIVGQGGGLTAELVRRLEGVHLDPGSDPATAAAQITARLPALLGPGTPPCAGVVVLSAITAAAGEEMAAPEVMATYEAVSTAVLAAIQRLIASGSTALLWLVTRGAVAVAGAPAAGAVAQASAWGLGRGMALEHPGGWGGIVDLPPTPGEADADLLVRHLRSGSLEDQVALRDGQRFALRLVPRAAPPPAPLSCKPDGWYVISGGLGGIGLVLARWLVDRGARRIALIGRGELGGEDPRRATLSALVERGAQVEVVRGDVADTARMEEALSELRRTAPLVGVIHAAGRSTQRALAELGTDDLTAVSHAKVAGAWNLHRLTERDALHLFVLCSSAAAVWGSAGLAHYSAANCFLDSLAAYRRHRGQVATSACFGPWDEVGMATPEDRRMFAQLGVSPMPPRAAVAAVEAAVATDEPQMVIADVDWGKFRPIYEARRRRPLVSELDTAAESSATAPRAAWVAELASLSPLQRDQALLSRIHGEVAAVLGLESTEALPIERALFDAGMDSMMAVEVQRRLSAAIGQRLPSTLVFNNPTVAALTEHLSQLLRAPDSAPEAPRVPERGGATVAPPPAAVPAAELAELSEQDAEAMLTDLLARAPWKNEPS